MNERKTDKRVMELEIRNKEDKTYIVLGSPHSGTSFLTRALKTEGIDIGKDLYKYQDRDFIKLNYTILKKAGGTWFDPPSEKAIMAAGYEDHIQRTIKEKKKKFWGWKEPTTSLMLQKFLPHLKGDVYLICIFRKTDTIVKSYKGQQSGRITKKLVDRYNRSILKAVKEFCGL